MTVKTVPMAVSALNDFYKTPLKNHEFYKLIERIFGTEFIKFSKTKEKGIFKPKFSNTTGKDTRVTGRGPKPKVNLG